MKKKFIEIAVKVVVAALTAFLTAITTTAVWDWGRCRQWIMDNG